MSLPKIYEQLGPESAKVMEGLLDKLFLPKYFLEEEIYLKFLLRYQKELQAIVAELLALWDTKEHRETLGHDKIHISYDLFEFLQLAQSGALKESEKYLTLFGALLHDLGRYPELLFKDRSEGMDFSLPKQIQFHAALSGHIWLLVFEKHKSGWNMDEEDAEVCEAFFYRILGAVLYHGGKNEERDIVAHHVQSCDRLAGILGSREFVRNIVTDGVQRGAAVYPDERLSYDKIFPMFNNLPVEKFANSDTPEKSWTNIVHYLEMPLRNMFPLSTEFGMERAKAMKRESGIILTLLSGGAGTDLYNQIFAPELNPELNREKEYKFPKTPLSEDIWQSIKAGKNTDEQWATEEYFELPLPALIDITLNQQAPDIPETERKKVHDLLTDVPDNRNKDIRNTLQYVVSCREINKRIERSFLLLSKLNCSDTLTESIVNSLLKSKLWL